MLNKLPEKLTLIRKNYGLSQGDVASKLDVKFTDYMNWENGNSIPSISNIRKLSQLYGIPVESFIDNTKVFELPKVQIEPVPSQDVSGGTKEAETLQTQQIETVKEDLGSTRVMDAEQIQSAGKKLDKNKESKQQDKKKRRQLSYGIIGGGLAAIIVLVVAIVFFMRRGSSFTVATSDLNRLTEGDTFTLFINKNNELDVYGDFKNKDDFKDVVQVSAYDSHAVGLKSDGTVVTTDNNSEVSQWKEIKAIAAGKNHTVGLTKDGTVVCAGSTLACEVSDWSDVESIYAGDDVTLAISNGEVKISGNEASFSGINNASKIAVGDTQALVLKKDGTVSAVALKGNTVSDVTGWSKITSIAVGKDYAVGVGSDGTMHVATSDKDMQEFVESWKNIQYVAAYDDTLVAFDRSGKMYGYGDNSNNQYDSSAKADAKQLSQVKNIEFTVTTANVNVKWDPVENADYYELTVNTNPTIEHKNLISNSDSIPSASLTNGQTYVVTITAYSNNEDKYKKSDSTTINFAYTAKTVQLSSPKDITGQGLQNAWHFAWSAVENADMYNVYIDGQLVAEGVQGTSTTIDGISFSEGSEHDISITARSSNPAYTESDAAKTRLKYTISKGNIKVNFEKDDGSSAGSKTYELPIGTYIIGNIVRTSDIPSGYKISNESATAEIMNGQTTEVTVRIEPR